MKRLLAVSLMLLFFLNACSSDSDSDGNSEPSLNKNLNRQSTGSSSADLLSDARYESVVIELVYVEGFEPTAATVENLVTFLEQRSFKPGGITVVKKSIPSPNQSPYTTEEIVAIEEANREFYNSGDTIAIWALFVDGSNEKDSDTQKILGTAYRNTSFVMYEQSIRLLSNDPFEPSRSVLETTAVHHEVGHLLGLVNLGAPLQSDHEDEDNEKHCNVEDCLMYFTAETGAGAMAMIQGGRVPSLDEQCIADLQANGGR